MKNILKLVVPVAIIIITLVVLPKLTRATFSVSVVGITNTQAVLSYTAPDSNACQAEVSENSGYNNPLVHDVDPLLFTGSDSDARAEAMTAGTSRIFVVGKRDTEKALDNVTYYSRALQADTLHYYRVTCGSSIATGTFTTANIPFGMTYQDIPQVDQANPGSVIMPTLTNLRTQKIVDPHTGALISRISLPADTALDGGGGTGPFMYSGGFVRVCGLNLITSGSDHGYLCSFAQGDGGFGPIYFIIPSTGEARYLGKNSWGSTLPTIGLLDNRFYHMNGGDLVASTYNGDYTPASPGTTASFSTAVILPNVADAIHAFDNNFNVADFGIAVSPVVGDYATIQARRGVQDTYGWIAIVKISTGSIIAAMRLDSNIQCRWCVIHQTLSVYDQPAVSITTHAAVGQDQPLGGGPYITTYSGGSTLTAGATTMTVAGEPGCVACGADPEVALAQVGDVFQFSDGGGESITITGKNSPTSWNISRGSKGSTPASHAPGATLTAVCSYTPIYWKFLADPHGTDTTNTNFIADANWPGGGHDDHTTGLRLAQNTGWTLKVGDLMTGIGQTITRTVDASPLFAGTIAQCYGDGCKSHPSAADGQTWLTDYNGWDGSYYDRNNNTLTPKSGQVYKYTPGSFAVNPKQFAIAGSTNDTSGVAHAFLDVSPAVLGTTSADSYKYCIANFPGECFAGSLKGEIYVNLPGSPGAGCAANGPCIVNFNAYAGGVMQIGISGTQTRVISGGLTGLRDTNDYPNAHALGDGSGILFPVGDISRHPPAQIVIAKTLPFSSQDSVDRTTFIRAPLTLTPPSGQGIVSATVEFGYAEFGTPSQHYCTSRREPCVAVTSSVTDSNPFNYEQTDTYTKMACTTNCTITLPVLPMHIAYYKVIYYNAGGAVVAFGDQGVAAESSVANINNLNPPPATSYTFTGPSSGNVNSASTNFTVTPVGGPYTGTITITPSGAGSAGLSPIVLTFNNSSTGQTFTITPTVAGSITLTGSNNQSIADANLTYTANAVLPGAPTSVAASAGNAQATVTFTAPASNGGVAISGYTVTSIPAGGTDSNAGTTGLSHVITGLTNGTSYTFTVKASNSVGQGPASSASNSVTPNTSTATSYTFTGPSSGNMNNASTNFTITPVGGVYTGTITITPSGGGLSPIILVFANSSAAQTFTITPTSAATITLTGTNNGTLTNPSNLTYVSNPTSVPSSPTGVSATPGNARATVSFTASASNGGLTITGYTVTSIPAGGTDINAGTTGLSHFVTGLTNGTSYTLTVHATNSAGNSAESSASNAVTPSGSLPNVSYSRSITIDHTKVPNTDQTNFPMLISLTDANLKTVANSGHVQSANGYDISFYSDAGLTTRLPAERETYDGAAGTYVGWVKVPTVSHTTDTVIYLGYGDASVLSDSNLDVTYGKTNVWDSNYKAVWHLPNGSALSGTDSTSNARTMTATGATATGGQIDGAASFGGVSDFMQSSSFSYGFSDPNTTTVSAWISDTALGTRKIIYSGTNFSYNQEMQLEVGLNGAGSVGTFFPGQMVSYTAAGAYGSGLHYITYVRRGVGATNEIYVDGVLKTLTANGTYVYTDGATDKFIGQSGVGSKYWQGIIDEVRVSGVGRSADWIKTEYNNQSTPGDVGAPGFYTVGGEQSSGPSTHTLSGTIKYYDGIKLVPTATVTLEDGSSNVLATTTTDVNGVYSFSNVADGGNYIVVASKTDGNGAENSADQIKIGRHIVGLETFDTIYKTIAADVNVDGALSSADQIKIGRNIVGLDVNLPSGAWKFYASNVTPTTGNYLFTGLSRTYTNLTADQTNQDFVGIKMGDTNNSW